MQITIIQLIGICKYYRFLPITCLYNDLKHIYNEIFSFLSLLVRISLYISPVIFRFLKMIIYVFISSIFIILHCLYFGEINYKNFQTNTIITYVFYNRNISSKMSVLLKHRLSFCNCLYDGPIFTNIHLLCKKYF